MDTTNLEGKLKEYIKHLCKARKGIEKKQDGLLGPCLNPHNVGVQALESEFITLNTVIRDLGKIAYPKEFSYWDA